eukprot:4939717-Karenia_brevis.AAC.1
MPGKHSEEKLAARRLRAIERGFLVRRSPDTQVTVPRTIANRMKKVAASLAVQRRHVAIAGLEGTSSAHSASVATLKASPLISK